MIVDVDDDGDADAGNAVQHRTSRIEQTQLKRAINSSRSSRSIAETNNNKRRRKQEKEMFFSR